ncbi:hypothetical protein [Bacillus cereus group sp. MYBK220-1]|uniref:hypothetical protein n=1 Tax=Bacillus cereus group sp. MYBK220-1 TaxID=3450660 RepID=UPI003F78B2FC
MAKKFNTMNGKTYYFDNNGAMSTGWLKENKNWYYLNANGSMKTNWLQKIEVGTIYNLTVQWQ